MGCKGSGQTRYWGAADPGTNPGIRAKQWEGLADVREGLSWQAVNVCLEFGKAQQRITKPKFACLGGGSQVDVTAMATALFTSICPSRLLGCLLSVERVASVALTESDFTRTASAPVRHP